MKDKHVGHGHNHHDKIKTTRNFEYLGNTIELVTTYEIKINGKEYNTHVMLGEDGTLTTHAIPYKTFPSMPKLLKSLIELYPNEFNNNQSHHHGS